MIPNDYSRCNNDECVLKDRCKRWLQFQIDTTPVYVTRFKPKNNECENIIL